MYNDNQSKKFESVYSSVVKAGKRRTYFFDVRKTKGEDFYVTMTESTKRFNGEGYDRHKIFLYKEDFNRFVEALQEVVDHVKNDLMPDYDYDEFTRRHEEYELQNAENNSYSEEKISPELPKKEADVVAKDESSSESQNEDASPTPLESEKDMEW